MFKNIDILYIIGPAIIIATILLLVLKNRNKRKNISKRKKALTNIYTSTTIFGGLLLILWLLLPTTASLQSFGYPENLNDIDSNAKMLELFQHYNLAIVRTTDVLHWFLFLFIWFFLVNSLQLISLFREDADK